MSSSPLAEKTYRYCGRRFSTQEIDRIRRLIGSVHPLNRAGLSRKVCDELGWLGRDGRRKEMSCRVAMLRMERDGLIRLPPPQNVNGNGRIRPRHTPASDPQEPITLAAGDLGQLVLRPVRTRPESPLWNELIERYHYLGYKPLPGAQIRYLVYSDPAVRGGPHLLAALGFGAAAWSVAPRDQWIGWTPHQRQQNLHLVLNNARFLILPWVRVPNLASRILAAFARRLPHDWQTQYGYRPLLLETFVERDRFRGTCYRAAGWILVGQTKGRGKLDKTHRQVTPIKDIFLYPLDKRFRKKLQLTP
jgi:hypothetical protein